MKQLYSDNKEIITFFNKAQIKIGQLAGILSNEEEKEELQRLLLDLSDFLECLDSIYCTYSITDVLRYIHFFNRRANLLNIPFIQVTDYVVNINMGTTATTIVDKDLIQSIVRSLLVKFPHNSLANIQGGILGERYHLTKEQVDWITCQMSKTPCPDLVPASVGLTLTTNGQVWPSGYYELGSSISSVKLVGSILLNSGKSVLATRYRKNGGILLGTEVKPSSTTPNPFIDTSLVTISSTYTFEAEFEVGGIKSAIQSINFMAPLYYGILKRDSITNTSIKTLKKDVLPPQNLTLNYTLPVGNTSITNGKDYTPVVEYPSSFGLPKVIKVLDYDFLPDWTFTTVTNTLTNGQVVQNIRGIFNNTIEGNTSFNFIF